MKSQHNSSRLGLGAALALALATSAAAQVGTNYTFASSTGSYSPITGTLIVAASGTSGTASLDDDTYSVSLPFSFVYDGVAQSSVWVSTNGWLSFGATSPAANTYTVLSSTAAAPGFVAAFARDLQGGYVCLSTRTSASNQVTGISNLGPIAVGDFISGTGIPSGATVTAIAGNTLTMSVNATSTSTGTAMSAFGPWSDMRWDVLGSSPNRVFVAQWSNVRVFGTTLSAVREMTLNFQIRLNEGTNAVECVYGSCSSGVATTNTTANQVGLRGPSNAFPANINNRQSTKGTTDWGTSVAGTSNSSGHPFNAAVPANVISNGLTYSWTPPVIPPCFGTPTPGLTVGPTDTCPGVSFTLSLQNTTPGTGVTYQWFSMSPLTALGTNPTQTVSQTSDTTYYCEVTCSSSTGTSTPLFVPMAAPAFPQTFGSGVVAPNCWSVSSLVGSSLPDYNAASAFAVGTGSVRYNFFSASNLNQLVLTSPDIAPVAGGTELYFDAAGATYTGGEIDTIVAEESNDGGGIWTSVATMTNEPGVGVLNTGGAIGSNFVPTSNQWTSLVYPLSAGTNKVRFRGVSNFGNSVFLDNISVGVMPSARHTSYGKSCGVPAATLTSATPPISGTTVVYDLGSIPLACPSPAPVYYFGFIMVSIGGQDFAGTDLLSGYGIEAPGCNLHVTSADLVLGYVDTVDTQTVPLDIPALTPPGFLFYSQAAALICPVAPNNAGIILTNGLRSYVNSF